MKKLLPLLLGLLFFFVGFSYGEEALESSKSSDTGADGILKRGLIASGEVLLSNFVLMAFNILFTDDPWATPSTESIRENYTLPWIWDHNSFRVNHLGHPYQGALYFSAGRVNGFGFYESLFFSALGSYTWETFCEGKQGSINDLITTIGTSMSLGEILYRLYLEADAEGIPAPAAFFINPIAGFHYLVTRREPPAAGGNIYQLNTYIGMGWVQTNFSLSDSDINYELFSFRGLIANAGFSTIYGNPFIQESIGPFNHFEIAVFFGVDAGNYMGIRVISDGYLFSFSPVSTDTDMMSTGLSLHFDVATLGELELNYSSIDQFSNALNWTIKYQHLFSEDVAFEAKAHLGVTFMGGAKIFPKLDEQQKIYGYGFNSKKSFALENKRVGRLEVSVFNYLLCGFYNISSAINFYWLFVDGIYYHYLSKNLSLAIANSFAMERGYNSGGDFHDTNAYNNEIKFFAVWRL